jgi:F-type H+-transporting ATPase subunit delta
MIISKKANREAKQLFRLCLVHGFLDENRVRQVVQYALAAGYRDTPAVLAHFLRLVKLDGEQHTAKVESANPFPPELQAAIKADLERRYGQGLTTNLIDRPDLIGGIRIQVGSDVYDGSVLAGLKALERSF